MLDTLRRRPPGKLHRLAAVVLLGYAVGGNQQHMVAKGLLDYSGDDAYQRCKAITESIVVVGGNQDVLVGECRVAVKVLRQLARLAMAVDTRAADITPEIRPRTQRILRNATSCEAPRH